MENKDNMVNACTFENISSWNVLQQNSKTTDIISLINQLLSMYHPDDGIAAYEHVLKTVLVLSENFDSHAQQQMISIVPLPKGASNEAIRDTICKTTSLIKRSNNITTCPKNNIIYEEKFDADISSDKSKLPSLNQNILVNASSTSHKLNENFVPPMPEVFRGFPPNEISMIHSHIKNVNYMYDTLNCNAPCTEPNCMDVRPNFPTSTDQQEKSLKLQSNLKFKWIHTPHVLYKNNSYPGATPNYQQSFLKSMENKYFQLPIDEVNYNQWNVTNMPHISCQDNMCLKKQLYKNEAIFQRQDKVEPLDLKLTNNSCSKPGMNCCELLYNESTNQSFKNCHNNINETRITNMEAQKYYEQELKIEEAIKQDIYKMDVVCWNEEVNNTGINVQVLNEDDFAIDNLRIRTKLKTSFKNFLKRAEQEIFIECPLFPQTKSLCTVPLRSKYWKFVAQKNLKNNDQLDLSINNINCSKDINSSENIKKLIQKKASGFLNIHPKSAQVFSNNLSIAPHKIQAVECEKQDSVENLLHKSVMKQTEQNNVNILQQSATITELATFKKQYYDTLLNIQKAKVAVANSLAISSMESSTKYDPYYSSHSYQQQQLLQHGQLTVSPQFAVHAIAQPGLSNMHNTPYTWVKYNDWRHSTVRQLRFPQQTSFQHSRNKE